MSYCTDARTYSIRRTLAYGASVVLLLLSNYGYAASSMSAAAYIELYGLVKPVNNDYVSRAVGIFAKLKRVSGLVVSNAKLVVVASDGKPWAVALEDGNVVLSKGAIDILYSAKNIETGDAWMAFVLGHELAHLRNNDHWHHNVQRQWFSQANNTATNVFENRVYAGSQNPDRIRARELRADHDGFLYASLAGFNTRLLFGTDALNKGFLHSWVEQTGTHDDNTHYTATERTEFLKSRLSELRSIVDFFDFGVRLSYFSRFDDALTLFGEFQNHYQSPAVMNNIAYVYLQLARKKMPVDLAYRFWFPTMLDTNAGLPEDDLPARSLRDEKLSLEAIDDLEYAVVLLIEAIAQTDANLSAHINLVAAYWYLGEMREAQTIVHNALEKWPGNDQLIGLSALVLLEQKAGTEADTWSRARDILESLVSSGSDDHNIVFNLARMLTERGRLGDAKQYWERLILNSNGNSTKYLASACLQYKLDCNRHPTPEDKRRLSYTSPKEIGMDIHENDVRERLADWLQVSGRLGATQVNIYNHTNGDSILALDFVTEMYLSKTYIPVSRLLKAAGPPNSESMSGDLLLFDSGWAARVRDDIVREILFVR